MYLKLNIQKSKSTSNADKIIGMPGLQLPVFINLCKGNSNYNNN